MVANRNTIHVRPKVRRGRPTKLTSAIVAEFCKLLPVCRFLDTIGDFLEISKPTWRNWLRRGRALADYDVEDLSEEDALYYEFFYSHKRAIAASEIMDSNAILAASKAGAWQASAWRLERCQSDRYGNQNRELREAQKNYLELKKRLDEMASRDDEISKLRQAEHEREQVIADLQRQLAEFRDGTAK